MNETRSTTTTSYHEVRLSTTSGRRPVESVRPLEDVEGALHSDHGLSKAVSEVKRLGNNTFLSTFRRLINRFTWQDTIIIDRPDFYSVSYFSKGDLILLSDHLASLGTAGRSQWYAHIDQIKSISLLGHWISIFEDSVTPPSYKRRFAAILPFQKCVCNGRPGIICVRDELRQAVYDFVDVISLKENWFPASPGVVPTEKDKQKSGNRFRIKKNSKTGAGEKGNGSEVKFELEPDDIEKVHNLDFPCLFSSLRFSSISDEKLRRIGMYEALKKALDFVKPLLPKSNQFWMVMRIEDYEQTGLFTISQSADYVSDFVRIRLAYKTFESFLKKLHSIDGLVIDALVFLNDALFEKKLGSKMYISNIRTTNISTERGIDPKLLSFAIYEAYFPPHLYLKQMHLKSKQISSSLLFEEKAHADISRKLAHVDVNAAIYYLMNILHLGYTSEQPRKIVTESKDTLHLCRNRAIFLNSRDNARANKRKSKQSDNDMKNKVVFQPFRRRVRSVTSTGYRVKSFSSWMWITLLAGVSIPIIYVMFRLNKADAEDIISAASAIVASYIVIMSPLIFQIFYRGEQLIDVLANVRNIDTQEEFDSRSNWQHVEILQIIRKLKAPPRFLGGVHESNTSYVMNEQKTDAFNAQQPMAFSNLELLGYGLFEDARGNMFMLDSWSCIFEMNIVNHSEDNLHDLPHHIKFGDVPADNQYIYDELDFLEINASSASFRCKAARKMYTVEKLLKENQSTTDVDIETGSIQVKFQSHDRVEKDVIISRILPFKIRRRCVEFSKQRSIRLETYWLHVRNRDLFDMHIGDELRNIREMKKRGHLSSNDKLL